MRMDQLTSMLARAVLGICLGVLPQTLLAETTPQPPLKTFHYRVRIPATADTCQNEALALANRFGIATKAPVTEALCKGVISVRSQGRSYELYSLQLAYGAKEELLPSSAIYSDVFGPRTPSILTGIFKNLGECTNSITLDSEVFTIETGLAAISATCLPDGSGESAKYVLRIDGFGKPLRQLQAYNPGISETAAMEMTGQIRELLAGLGAHLTKQVGTTTFFYAEKPLALRSQHFGYLQSPEACNLQLPQARAIFLNSGATRTIARCLPGIAESAALIVLGDGSAILSRNTTSSNDKYYSFDECVSDRDRALADAVTRGARPLGAICRPDDMMSEFHTLDIYSKLIPWAL